MTGKIVLISIVTILVGLLLKNSSTETNNMEFVSLKRSTSLQPTSTTTIHEYVMTDPVINGAVADIHGRYPEKGFAVNSASREIVYVIDGSGIVGLLDKSFNNCRRRTPSSSKRKILLARHSETIHGNITKI